MRESEGTKKAASAIRKYLVGTCSSEDVRQAHLVGSGAVAELEEKLKQLYGVSHALCVSSATTGLLAIALALDLDGAKFITTPYTYGASLAGWLLLGARPVFADIDPFTLTLDCDSVRSVVTPKTKAILAVDIFGNPADQAGLRRVSDELGLWYIADAAQSLGTYRCGLPASSLADTFVVSFTTGKTVFAGEGGAVLTNNPDLYNKLVWHTQHPYRQKRDVGLTLRNEFAVNGRIHPLAAVWANACFSSSLENLKRYQLECFQVVDALNSIGLTEYIGFKERDILPSFFRLNATWKQMAQPSRLLGELERRKLAATFEQPPVHLIYDQPAFIAQFRRRIRNQPHCPIAERYARDSFCITRSDTSP